MNLMTIAFLLSRVSHVADVRRSGSSRIAVVVVVVAVHLPALLLQMIISLVRVFVW